MYLKEGLNSHERPIQEGVHELNIQKAELKPHILLVSTIDFFGN